MSAIFLSYNRGDQDVARRFAEAFEANGLSVWWDVTLRSGEHYDEVTEAALLNADAVVVLWSKKSVSSRWVRSEATVGQRTGKLVPVMIEPCARPVMFELVQTADLCDWRGELDKPAWRALLADVQRLHRRGGEVSTPVQLATSSALKLPNKPSLALLPFSNLGPPDDDHLAAGLVEEISTVLSRFSSLFVIAGQTSLSYRGSSKPAREIARELGVRYLLEGSVRRGSGRVRIAAKLVDAPTGEQVWAERFDEPCADLFELQDRVANAVASTMDASLNEAEMRRAVVRPTESPDAYELTVRANALLGCYTRATVGEALRLAEQAIVLDPDYAWAIAIAGFCHATLLINGWAADPELAREQALLRAGQARKVAGDDQMALTVTGGVLLTLREDIGLARQLIERALALNPGKAFALFWAGVLDGEAGQFARGLKRQEQALRLNPRSIYRPFQLANMAACLLGLDRCEEAALVAREVLRGMPDSPSSQGVLTASLALLGRIAEAKAAQARLEALGGWETALHWFAQPAIRDRLERARERLESGPAAPLPPQPAAHA